MVKRIMPDVERLRGLSFKRPVPVRVVNDDEARAHFQSRLGKFWPEAQMKADNLAYIQLGLLPERTDIKETLFGVLKEQAGGYYDPETDAFYVLGDMPRSSAPILMAHELTHALDDQHYGIDELIEKAGADQERASALGAVVEGSGTLVMTQYIVEQIGSGSFNPEAMKELTESEAGRAETLKASPPIIQRGLLSSYILGQSFLLHGEMNRLTQPVSTVELDRAFRQHPVSTEQILHPAKYWDAASKDLPREIRLPDICAALGDGWAQTGKGTLGELNLALLTGATAIDPMSPEASQAAAWTNPAAAGWGGDEWRLCARGEETITILATVWDTETDAAEFEKALAGAARFQVRRRRDAVIVIAGGTPEQAGMIADRGLEMPAPGASPAPR